MLLLLKEHEKYFKKFNIVSMLGQGSFGTVYKVHDKSTDEKFALKEVKINFKHLNTVVNELLPPGIKHPNILNYSALMICRRPCKLSENNFLEYNKKEICYGIPEYKQHTGINLYEELMSDNLNMNYEDFSSPELIQDEQIRSIDLYDSKKNNLIINSDIKPSYKLKKSKSIPACNINTKNSECSNLNKSRSWGLSTKMNEPKKFRRNKSVNNEYFLYLKTKICEFSLRDFLDVRNNCLFKDNDISNDFGTADDTIEYEGLLNTSVKIPVNLYKKSITNSKKICKKFSLNIFRYILLGLIYLHSIGIAHNDLKPSNVFMDGYDSYIPRIGDFGSKTVCKLHQMPFETFENIDKFYYHEYHGKSKISCDHQNTQKVFDCRSLAPILFELLHPSKTHSEMINIIRILKKTKKVPLSFRNENLNESLLIESILNSENITAKDILRMVDTLIINL
ncbi:hypothetical protein P3W45_001322 [Vairimorpha bombi]|jgi:serine/threonine protein kinase